MNSRFPDTQENRDKIDDVASAILGTSKSLDNVVQEVFGDESMTYMDLDIALLQRLDEHTLECTECGWWCEAHEVNDDGVCVECEGEQ